MLWTGDRLTYYIYGESHSDYIGVSVEGLPIHEIDIDRLSAFMDRRRAKNEVYSTKRIEPDVIQFVSGIENSTLTGDRFEARIKNTNVKSSDYNDLEGKPRPSHADYASYLKYGRTDYRGGHEFSGRMTAPLCIVGGIAKQILEDRGVKVLAYVHSIGEVEDISYKDSTVTSLDIENMLSRGDWAMTRQEDMLSLISLVASEGDSIGGTVEVIVEGLAGGYGGAMTDGLEGKISSLLYSIPAVKGVEFGAGFDISRMRGSEANDELHFVDGEVVSYTNHAGGINGGISNGMPITARVAFRPTPSISREQRTVDLIERVDTTISIKGRHDACIVPRTPPIVESAVAIAILDSMEEDKICK
ncbi:MAG: chorismate synthase [Clostridia bacterium]|nr:chorismate synthase [Clostridia bacterium]